MEFSTPARSSRAVEPPCLSAEQQHALARIERHLASRSGRPFVIFGCAGTGKTLLLASVAARFPAKVLAPTGRVSALLARKIGRRASTIHSAIYKVTDESSDRGGPGQPEFELAVAAGAWAGRVLLIDEISMIGARLGRDLLRTGATVVAFGDPAQLPPVDDQAFFTEADIELKTVHRQAAGSPILRQATRVRSGGFYRSDTPDFRVVKAPSDDDMRSADIVLCFRNDTRKAANARIRWLKGYGPGSPQKGERLLALRNDYRAAIFNGELFTLMADIGNDHLPVLLRSDTGQNISVHATFPGVQRPPDAPAARLSLDWGYCATVHRAQGSEFDSVVIIDEFPDGPDRIKWLYTALTRARKRVVVARGIG